MSFWRKRQIADEVKKAVEPEVAPERPEDDFNAEPCVYSVGKNRAGNTQLKSGYNTLTMSPAAVVDLIKILAVTISDKYIVNIESLEELVEKRSEPLGKP